MTSTIQYFVVYETSGEKHISKPFDNKDRATNLAARMKDTYELPAVVIEIESFGGSVASVEQF